MSRPVPVSRLQLLSFLSVGLAPLGLGAASVNLTADDGIGSSSFNAAGNWSPASAPASGNAYLTNDFLLRTPATTAATFVFAGDSLTVNATGNTFPTSVDLNDSLMFKGTITGTATVTIASLDVDGGNIRHADNEDTVCRIAGNRLGVGPGGLGFHVQGPVYIDAPITGSGPVFILGNGSNSALRTVHFSSAANTHTGNLTLLHATQSRFILDPSAVMKFVPGASGVSNRVSGPGVAAFDGIFVFDLTAADPALGASWNVVDVTTLTESFGGTFAVSGFSDPDGDGTWTSADGNFSFSETTGTLVRVDPRPDTDADGLPDVWEQAGFATLDHNAGDDPDGDYFSNLQEYAAGTSPNDLASRPAGTAAKLVPVDDGDPSTSEFGYAGPSAINSVAFVRSSLQTFGDQQFMTWYGRHQYDASAVFNNTLWIGRRTVGSSRWQIFKHPTFTANTITDGHDVISFGIDGDGFLHLSWGMHGDAFHYSRSTTPVTDTQPIALGADTTMTGTENAVTYPQFLRLPDGDLLYLFREVASGNGDTYVNRYDLATRRWANVHGSTNTQSPFIKGTGWSPNYNAYLNLPQLGGPDGDDLILTWCWRFSSGASDNPGSNASGYQTNNRLNFARSPDAGLTWQKHDGTAYTLPITRNGEAGAGSTAEVIHDIPENYSLINQASTCLDSAGNPVTATWWAPDSGAANFRRQYMVVFRHDNGTWQARAVSSRTSDPTTVRYAENHVRDLGRPTVVRDDADRIIVAYRDNNASNLSSADNSLNVGVTNGITIVHSLPRSEDPDRLLWISFDLTAENLGNYETMIDNELWDQKRQLHFLYQPSGGQGYAAPANTASRISVLEWDAADYFTHSPQPGIDSVDGGAGVRIHWRSEPSYVYRLQTSTDLIDWSVVETRPGTGARFEYHHTFSLDEPKCFWRLDRAEGPF